MAESSLFWYGKASQGAPGDAGGYTDVQFTEFVKVVFEFRTGVLSGLRVTPTSPASKSVQVAAGTGAVRGKVYFNDAVRTLAIADNTSGSTRIDRIIVRVDYAAQTVRLAVLEGTPGAGTPALTQNEGTLWEESLAQLSLANGFATITEAEITRERTWIRSAAPGDTKFSFKKQSQETDWLLCDGRAVSRTTYADLFDAIGTDHGAGDGSTTFNIPDFRGRGPIGLDNMGTPQGSANINTQAWADTLGGKGGAESLTQSGAQVGQHSHSLTFTDQSAGSSTLVHGSLSKASYGTVSTANNAAPSAMNILNPGIAGHWYIKT